MVSISLSRYASQRRFLLCLIAIIAILISSPVFSHSLSAVNRSNNLFANANYGSFYNDIGMLLANDENHFIPWNFYYSVVFDKGCGLRTSPTTDLASTISALLENILSIDTTSENVVLSFVYKGTENE